MGEIEFIMIGDMYRKLLKCATLVQNSEFETKERPWEQEEIASYIKKEAGISQMTKIQRNAKPTYPGVSPSRPRKNDVEDDSGALELPCPSRCDDASELL